MAWVRIEDAVTEHRKHLLAGPAACWLWVCGIAYCQRQMSDGFIPDLALPLLGVLKGARSLADRLVDVKLFERVDGGFRVHDYHDYNDTKNEALARKVSSREQHRQAGLASGRARRVERTTNGAVERPLNPVPSHPIPSHPDQTTTSSVAAEPHVVVWTKSGVQSDRIYLHRWQLEALIDTLGPHADDFALDLWVAGLSAKATAEGLVLPRKAVWDWVQAELTKEIQTRGLPLATIGDVTDADKLDALIAKGPSVRP